MHKNIFNLFLTFFCSILYNEFINVGAKYTQIVTKCGNSRKLTMKGVDKMSFIGIYFHNLDAKNRLFIPVKYRDDLGEKFVVMPGPHGNLWLYPTDVFEGIAEQYRRTHTLEEQSNFFSSVSNGSVDNQGRLNIETRFKEHANLKKEVVLSGGGKRVEVWPIENFRPGKVELKDAIDYSADVDW